MEVNSRPAAIASEAESVMLFRFRERDDLMSRCEIRFWWALYLIGPVIGIAAAFIYKGVGLPNY
jgi:hypothetical protein